MNDLRAIVAISIFFISGYLVFDLFLNGFSWVMLIGAIMGFITVHFIWPQSDSDVQDGTWYSVFSIFLDLPYQFVAFIIRGIGDMFFH